MIFIRINLAHLSLIIEIASWPTLRGSEWRKLRITLDLPPWVMEDPIFENESRMFCPRVLEKEGANKRKHIDF